MVSQFDCSVAHICLFSSPCVPWLSRDTLVYSTIRAPTHVPFCKRTSYTEALINQLLLISIPS